MITIAPAAEAERIEEFKARTRAKLSDVRCPQHRQAPRIDFRGATLRDISISMSGCCDHLIRLANDAIATR